jgi:hypothetical protein
MGFDRLSRLIEATGIAESIIQLLSVIQLPSIEPLFNHSVILPFSFPLSVAFIDLSGCPVSGFYSFPHMNIPESFPLSMYISASQS